MTAFRSGFVAIAGRPNVGKSTLLNALVGQKVAIVSDKPQTTRNRVQCVLTRPDAQIVFLDTPGIHKPQHRLGEQMVQAALRAWDEVDAILFMVDAAGGIGPGDRFIAERLQSAEAPVILAANKLDAAKRSTADLISECHQALPTADYASVMAISAQTGEGLDELVQTLIARLPEGPKYYPDDWITDHPERFVVGELIREQVLHLTRDEVPHAVAVYVERMAPREAQDLVDVDATIYVERDSQRGIVIGKNGAMVREIGTAARRDIEALLGSQINLQLWVKVKRDWRNKEGALTELGYRNE